MILRIILEYWIQYCISYVHDFSILGNFLPARMVTVKTLFDWSIASSYLNHQLEHECQS